MQNDNVTVNTCAYFSFPVTLRHKLKTKRSMKAKLLLMLFLVSLSLGVFASEHHQKKPHAVCKVYEKVATRIPFIFSVQTEDINDCLYLTFQFSLDDADITMLDKDGNEKV